MARFSQDTGIGPIIARQNRVALHLVGDRHYRGAKLMGQRNKNVHRHAAMKKFSKRLKPGELFNQRTLRYYMNNYIGVNGRRHKQTTVTRIELTSLLRTHPSSMYQPAMNNTGWWIYIGDEEE